MVKVNGLETDACGKMLLVLLEERGYDSGRIAVEMNGKIIPRADYGSIILRDCDSLEIVTFVGGG